MGIELAFIIFLLTLLMITAIAILVSDNLFVTVMLAGLYSLQMASIFFLLDAADVALTEAAVGAGVSTVLMLGALALTRREERVRRRSRGVAMLVIAVILVPLILASTSQPRLGDPDAPVHQHVAPWYLEQTPVLVDVPNVVTAILASYRGFDTLGELFVILTAGIGVLFLLSDRRRGSPRRPLPDVDEEGLRHHLAPRVVGTLLTPFIVLFGLYVQFHGDYGPGGGFQAGALVCAGFVLYSLIAGEAAALRLLPMRALLVMIAAGGLLYTGTGVAGIVLGGNFLDYNVLAADPVAGQHLGILLVELGVGLTVTGVLLSIYHAFAARRSAT